MSDGTGPTQGTNNNILVSDEHHAWLKAEAKRRGITMQALADEIVTEAVMNSGGAR